MTWNRLKWKIQSMLQAFIFIFPLGQRVLTHKRGKSWEPGEYFFFVANLVQEDVTCCLSRSVTFCGTKIRARSLLHYALALQWLWLTYVNKPAFPAPLNAVFFLHYICIHISRVKTPLFAPVTHSTGHSLSCKLFFPRGKKVEHPRFWESFQPLSSLQISPTAAHLGEQNKYWNE
jgi:hypothetical protein